MDQSGFLIDLSDSTDSVAIHRSTIDYALSVWILVYGEDDSAPGGGSVDVIDSVMQSMDPNSEGIIVAASESGGSGRFVRVTFVALADTTKVLFAGQCHSELIVGAPERCGPLDL